MKKVETLSLEFPTLNIVLMIAFWLEKQARNRKSLMVAFQVKSSLSLFGLFQTYMKTLS